jgi:hypothetical protein
MYGAVPPLPYVLWRGALHFLSCMDHASNGSIVLNEDSSRMRKEAVMEYLKVLPHLTGGTEDYHEKQQSLWPASDRNRNLQYVK